MPRVLLLFLDGVGIGPPDPEVNPFFCASLPTLAQALGGVLPTAGGPRVEGLQAKAFPLDACLGMDGTPQSGTGQIALLTGRNAPQLFGRHFGPWPPVRLRPLLEQENIFRRAQAAGARVVFANAHPRGYPTGVNPRRVAAFALAAGSAGLLDRDQNTLAQGQAVASEIVNDSWRERARSSRIPRITPQEAGSNLARITESADLTVFAHYHTDLVGHRGGMSGAVSSLERVDGFLSGLLDGLASDTLVVIASDHGNIEDVRRGHTRNPALGVALGRAGRFTPPTDLTEVAGAVLAAMGRDR
ncbi:MAG: metalloenzyme [Gemmatimonadetes bacterium]|nr:metalloenzyme [Gemmatimonadota bacterium]